MRRDVKKFLFVGVSAEKEAFFQRAQSVGIVEFIDTTASVIKDVPEEVQHIVTAIKILRGMPVLDQEELDDLESADQITNRILELKNTEERSLEEERMVAQEIARIRPFGDFALSDVSYIEKEGKRKVQFYCAKEGLFHDKPLPPSVMYVESEHGLDYFVGFNREATFYDGMIEIKVERSLSDLNQRLQDVKQKIHLLDKELKEYSKYNEFLHNALLANWDQYHLEHTQRSVQKVVDGALFAIEGWVPVHKLDVLRDFVDEFKVHCEEIAVETEDRMPTCLDNKGLGRIGEDVIGIYDIPSVTDKDPSMWVLAFFMLFFAIILGDGGYGTIYLGLALYLRYKYPKIAGGAKRVLNLFTMLSCAVICYGVLTSSFFGIDFDWNSPVRNVSGMKWMITKKAEYHMKMKDDVYEEWVNKYPALKDVHEPAQFVAGAVIDQKDGGKVYEMVNRFSDNIAMELALFLGAIHVAIGMIRYMRRNQASLGWLMFLIGGYLYIPIYLDATSYLHFLFGVDKTSAATEGLKLVYGGIGLAMVINIIKNKIFGIFEIMKVVEIFADVLSYLRLYALGLAGSILAATVNEMAASSSLVFGIVIILIGHAINISLGIMGGVIHGLRLNFLEWYHYCFEGGGKKFKPLAKVSFD